jgi:DNA adenine methylase
MLTRIPARPFVKWAGGKQALASELVRAFPRTFKTYFEPFLGGGSVFFTLLPAKSRLSDSNKWLIETFVTVRDHYAAVAKQLDSLTNTREEFLRIRGIDPSGLDSIRKAAHFIYLNKTCFRGLFRVNRHGKFNVPYGNYQRRYYDKDELSTAAGVLRGAALTADDFENAVATADRGDFVYFDPPYLKLGGYSDFNRYTATQFRESDHRRLASVCASLSERGVLWALSNSDTDTIRQLYKRWNVCTIQARREINLSSAKRNIKELLITNY